MFDRKLSALLIPAALLAVQTVTAAPFTSMDPRSMAMGGAGVAGGNSYNAPLFNPALLATLDSDDDFTLIIPAIGFRVADPDDLVDAIDVVADTWDVLDANITAFNPLAVSATQDADDIVQQSTKAVNALKDLDSKPIEINGGGAVVLTIPGEKFGIGVYGTGMAVVGAEFLISDVDINGDVSNDGLQDVINAFDAWSPGDPAPTVNLPASSQSQVHAMGAVIREVGVSIATNIDVLGGIAIGVTPKVVKVDTVDVIQQLDTADAADFTDSANRKSFSDSNIDVGIVKELPLGFRLGLVAKNIFAREYETVTGADVSIDPQYRVGLAHITPWTIITADMDLKENDPLGLDDPTQYLALGAEFDLGVVQLRAGTRTNLASKANADKPILTAGIGLYFGMHIDLAVAGNDEELAAALQLGFSF